MTRQDKYLSVCVDLSRREILPNRNFAKNSHTKIKCSTERHFENRVKRNVNIHCSTTIFVRGHELHVGKVKQKPAGYSVSVD